MYPIVKMFTILATSALLLTACGKKESAPKTEPLNTDKLAAELFPATAAPSLPITPVATVPPTTVVATVNGQQILRSEIDREVQSYLMRVQGRAPPERIAQMRPELEEQARENLITRNLLAEAAKAAAIEVPEVEVDQAVEKLRLNAPNGSKLEDVVAQVGLTMDTFRAQFASDLRINKLLERETTNVAAPTEEQIKTYYDSNAEQFEKPESVRASHILLSTQNDSTDEAKAAKRKKADDLRAQLVAGADFAELAGKESDCPSKAQGGDLGSFRSGQMVPAFEKAAFAQKSGEIGEVVETQFGFHIIKVASHEQPGKVELAEVKERLSEFLSRQNRQEAVRKFIEGLRAQAKITTLP